MPTIFSHSKGKEDNPEGEVSIMEVSDIPVGKITKKFADVDNGSSGKILTDDQANVVMMADTPEQAVVLQDAMDDDSSLTVNVCDDVVVGTSIQAGNPTGKCTDSALDHLYSFNTASWLLYEWSELHHFSVSKSH